ncbi:unnamed protein product, partial [Echinostoma caproni]|uniref:Calponin-homology (CH) domain-containing protein n=1 Tax=Echinostoma caproni TaxID=27848 RepID=A0A183A9H7_9TREM
MIVGIVEWLVRTIWVHKRNCWVQDLFLDLRSGYLLVRLLEILTNEVLGLEYIESRVHWIQNVQRVLNFLRYRGIRIVNIRADEIVDGNPKLTLGLIWIIILHFHLAEVLHNRGAIRNLLRMETSVDEVTRQSLLDWCRTATAGYPGVFVRDFTDSWRDGRAFLALIHRYKPRLIDFRRVDAQTAKQNIEWAFSLAELELHVARLFDSEDVSAFSDEKSIMTYVASLYEALAGENPIVPPMPSLYGEAISSTAAQMAGVTSEASKQLQSRWSEYRALASDLAQWLRSTADRMASRHFPPDLESMQHRILDELKRHRRDERPRRERERQQLVRMFEELKPALHSGQLPNDPFLSIDQIHRLWGEYDVALQEREMAARSETNRLDRLQWAGDRVVRECKAVDAQLTGLERHLHETSSGLDASRRFGIHLDRWAEQLGVVETRINGLFNQVQHLRSGRYTQTDQIYRDVCTLHQRLLDLQRRFRNRVQTNGFHSTITSITATPASVVGRVVSPGSRLVHDQTDERYEFLTPIQRCLKWIEEHLVAVEEASYGTNWKSLIIRFRLHVKLKSVYRILSLFSRICLACTLTTNAAIEEAARRHEHTHREILAFRQEVERCRNQQSKVIYQQRDSQVFEESMHALDEAYNKLTDASARRGELAKQLLDFVRRAEHELAWLREQESREVNRDWSRSDCLDTDEIRTFAQSLMEQLRDREIVYSELNSIGSSMQLENQSAAELVQSYLTALDRHWSWFLQLMGCLETRLEQVKRSREFYGDASRCEAALNANLSLLCTEFGPNQQPRSSKEASQMKVKLQTIIAQVAELESQVNVIVQTSQEILPSVLDRSSSPGLVGPSQATNGATDRPVEHPFLGHSVRAICCFKSSDYWVDNQPASSKFDAVVNPVIGHTYWPAGEEPSAFEKGDRLVVVDTADIRVWKKLHADGLRHLLALRLSNRPAAEIDSFQKQLDIFQQLYSDYTQKLSHPIESASSDSEEQQQRVLTVVEKLRGVFDTLAARLQACSAEPLPGCLTDLENRIRDHKEWTQDLARARTQCLELDQYIKSHPDMLALSALSIHTQSLRSASSQLQLSGQGRAHLLANTDAWLVHLDEVDQALVQCETRLLTSAVHNHGLMHVDCPLEPANPDGAVAERLPSLRNELDVLAQQLDSMSTVATEGLSRSATSDNVITDASLLQLLLPADSQALELNLAASHRRLGAATKQVELELKFFGDALRQFTCYRTMREQTIERMNELSKRAVAIGELARSVGLDRGPDTNLIKAALLQ